MRHDADIVFFEVIAFVLGALIGSFLNVVIVRLPEGESIIRPRSKCPKCGDMIPGYLNVPILSWIVLRGRCRACKAPISIRYPVIELLTALLFLACYQQFHLTWKALAAAAFAAGLVVITFVDLQYWEIPDEVSLPGIVAGLIARPLAFGRPWWEAFAGIAIGAGFLWLLRQLWFWIRKREAMGLGDLKLLAMIGAFLGPFNLLPVIFIASMTGSVIGLLLLAVGRWRGYEEPPPPPPDAPEDDDNWVPPKYSVPFGPFLALGAMTVLFFERELRAILFIG